MKDNLNTSHMSHHSKRSKSFGIGSDAASSYYFSSVPKTPAVKSARKQQRLSSHMKKQSSLNNRSQLDENVDPQRDGDLSLLDMDHDDNISSASTSMLLSPSDDPNNDSTMSSACSDNLNKSVLSDTTELTASNYVFAAASRNRLEESMMEFKALQKMKQNAEQHAQNDKDPEEADTADIQTLFQSKVDDMGDSVDIDKLVDLSNSGSSDESLRHESTMSEDNTNEMKQYAARLEAAMEFEEGESFLSINDSNVKHNQSIDTDSNTQQESNEDVNGDNQDMMMSEEVNVSYARRNSSNAPATVSKLLDTSKDSSSSVKVHYDASNHLQDSELSFRASTVHNRLSSTPLLDLTFSASRSRRMSSISKLRPDSELKKHSQRIQSITESITKSRQYRESIKKNIGQPRHSLPPSAKFAGLSALEKTEQNHTMNDKDTDGLEATLKANNTTTLMDTTFEQEGDRINDILGDLNNDMDESVEHVSPEKLNLSFDRNGSSLNDQKEVTKILKSPLLNRAKTPNLPSAERVFNPLAASPGRNTRYQVKKRKSMGENSSIDFESSGKKVNRSATPRDKASMHTETNDSIDINLSKDIEDDTLNVLDFIVPRLDVQAPKEDSPPKGDKVDLNLESQDQESEMSSEKEDEVDSMEHQRSLDNENAIPGTSQNSEDPTLLLSSGSTVTSNVKVPLKDASPKSSSKRESSSTYRLINPSVSSMTSSVAKLSTAATMKSPFVPPTSTTKSKTLLVSSPLSGAEEEEDEDDNSTVKSTLSFRSINSPASSGSNEEASTVSSNLEQRFKEDDDIADTIDLQNIMADLDENFSKSSNKRKMDRRRRSSSRFSISTSSNTEDHTSVSRSLADTQDIQGLLNDDTVRKPSLLPIQESPMDSSPSLVEKVGCQKMTDSPDRDFIRDVAVTATPKSILKRKKSMTPKLNVAFCPPTAAEYNVGSPASKFTPMCDVKTRERFQVPTDDKLLSQSQKDNTLSSLESFGDELSVSEENSVENGTHTIALENDLGKMLQEVAASKNVTSYSVQALPASYPADSSAEDDDELSVSEENFVENGTHTIALENDLGKMLQEVAASKNDTFYSASYPADSSAEDSNSFIRDDKDDASHTIGLESGLNEMLHDVESKIRPYAYADSSVEDYSCTLSFQNSSIDHKMEGETIVLENDLKDVLDLTNRASTGFRQSNQEHSDSFSVQDSLKHDAKDGDTIPIESDMKHLLDKVNTSFDNTNTLSLHNASVMRPMDGDTIELDSDLGKLVGCINESSTSNVINSHLAEDDTISLNDASIVQQSHGDTIELESDIQDLLRDSDGTYSFKKSSPNFSIKVPCVDNNNAMSVEGTASLDSGATNQVAKSQYGEKPELSSFTSSGLASVSKSSINSKSMTSDLIDSLEKVIGLDSSVLEDTIELNSSPNLLRSHRRSSRRISLVPPPSDATSSTGDYSGISALLKENIISIHSIHPKTPDQEEIVNIKWTEVSSLFSRLKQDDLFSDVHDVLMQEAQTLLSGYNHSDMMVFLNDFFDNVCSELDDGADDIINGDELLSELVDIPADVLLSMQNSIRGVSTHAAFNEFKNKLNLLELASLDVVNNEFVKWETLVANALSSRIDEMKHDIDEDVNEIVRRLGLSDNIQESLNILSQRAIKNARLEEIRNKKVSNEDVLLFVSRFVLLIFFSSTVKGRCN